MTKPTEGEWTAVFYAIKGKELEQAKALGLEPTRMLTNDGGVPIISSTHDDGGGVRVAVADLIRQDVKRGQTYKAEDAERDANALVMAASKDLLRACKALLEARDYLAGEAISPGALIWKSVEAAVAKAEPPGQ